jgi:hypothetical protein
MDKNLPQFLWGEAIHVVVIILNLRSTKAHPNKTLEELFTGHTSHELQNYEFSIQLSLSTNIH